MSERVQARRKKRSGVSKYRVDAEINNSNIVSAACMRFFKSRGLQAQFVHPQQVTKKYL